MWCSLLPVLVSKNSPVCESSCDRDPRSTTRRLDWFWKLSSCLSKIHRIFMQQSAVFFHVFLAPLFIVTIDALFSLQNKCVYEIQQFSILAVVFCSLLYHDVVDVLALRYVHASAEQLISWFWKCACARKVTFSTGTHFWYALAAKRPFAHLHSVVIMC